MLAKHGTGATQQKGFTVSQDSSEESAGDNPTSGTFSEQWLRRRERGPAKLRRGNRVASLNQAQGKCEHGSLCLRSHVAEEQVAGAGVAEEDDGEEDEKVDEVHEGVADGAGDERHLRLEVEDLEDAQDEEDDCGGKYYGAVLKRSAEAAGRWARILRNLHKGYPAQMRRRVSQTV